MHKISVYSLCIIAMLASIEYVVFTVFSNVLYLEFITFTVFVFALNFKKEQSFWGSVVFTAILLLIHGVTFWNFMYLLIYPSYTLINYFLGSYLKKYRGFRVFLCGFEAFLTGQLLQLPYMLFSKNLTYIYIVMGLKTSLIQGVLGGFVCLLLYDNVAKVLNNLLKERNL